MPAAPLRSRGASWYLRALVWAGIVWVVVFWRLGYPSLMDPDEAHYAELTREMLRARAWLVPLLDGQPYIDKPVLFHWLQGAAMWLFGETEFAARLPSAIASLFLFWTTKRLGAASFGAAVGEWGAIMVATIPAAFMLASIGLFDMLFTAFLFGAVAFLLLASRGAGSAVYEAADRRREVAGYALLALAVMIKGPVALVLVGLFCAAAWALGGELRVRIGRLHWMWGLAAAGAAASPWFVWMYAHFGDAFVQGYLLGGNLYYFTQPEAWSGRAVDHAYYLRSFAGGFFPWSAIALARVYELARRRARADADERLLWTWTVVVVGFFSLARFKLDHYIFPAAPAVCLLAAKAWHDAAAAEGASGRAVRVAALALAGLLVVAGTFTSVYIFELGLELPLSAILLPILLAAGGIGYIVRAGYAQWRLPRQPLAFTGSMLAIYAVLVLIGLPTLDRIRPTALVARTLRDHAPTDAPAAIYRLEQWRASLRYYAERPLAPLATPEAVRDFLAAEDGPRYVVMIRRDYRALRNVGFKLHEVFRCRAVVGTTKLRAGLRRQQWDDLIIVTRSTSRGVMWLP